MSREWKSCTCPLFVGNTFHHPFKLLATHLQIQEGQCAIGDFVITAKELGIAHRLAHISKPVTTTPIPVIDPLFLNRLATVDRPINGIVVKVIRGKQGRKSPAIVLLHGPGKTDHFFGKAFHSYYPRSSDYQ
ncbi:MAG: hypothetical protein AB9Q21_10510 [Candidatus Reddybacter sp.]